MEVKLEMLEPQIYNVVSTSIFNECVLKQWLVKVKVKVKYGLTDPCVKYDYLRTGGDFDVGLGEKEWVWK